MPVSKKPRKKYQPKNTVDKANILMPHQKYGLAMPVYTCLVRASIKSADEDDFHTVAGCLNVAIVVATNKGNLPQTVALLAQGAQILNGCEKDLNKVTEEDMKILGAAVNMADELNNHVLPEELKQAIETVMQFTQEVEDVVFHESV